MQFKEIRSGLFKKLSRLQDNELDFDSLAFEVFEFQRRHNDVYVKYLSLIGKSSIKPSNISEIPTLPIQFFKEYTIQSGEWDEDIIFESSGTGGKRSKHFVRELDTYHKHSARLFSDHFGDISQYCFLALLPGYMDRKGSSLIEMVNQFIKLSKYNTSGFYLDQYTELHDQLKINSNNDIPTILFAVSFALLDFIEQESPQLSEISIIETGGMKSSIRELTKKQIFNTIKERTNCAAIHSEYGMTELLSQCYAIHSLLFECPFSLRVFTNEINDPFQRQIDGKSGQLNIIDLANIDTCAFIQTEDLAIMHSERRFELLGRMQVSEMRGCNLLLEEIK